MRPLLLILFIFLFNLCSAQRFHLKGTIRNAKREGLSFVSVQLKDQSNGTTSREDGTYDLVLEEGKYDVVFSIIGYKSQHITIIISKADYLQDIPMEEDGAMAEVVLRSKAKDRSEEIMRNVIRSKDAIMSAAGSYSCDLYIRATQEDSFYRRKKNQRPDTSRVSPNAGLNGMALVEITLHLDRSSIGKIKEERTGVKKRGNAESLFFLSTTEGEFNFYENLVRVPSVASIPFLSPVSYSGLVAYKFRLVKTNTIDHRKYYTISVKPRQLSNATVEGEITVMDSLWVITHTELRLPSQHLPEYDYFEIQQDYRYVNEQAWMINKQRFIYYSKNNKGKKSGQTLVDFSNYSLNKTFPRNHFGVEVSSTAQEAYDKDSSFWSSHRAEPLTAKEVRFIQYRDSIYRVTHTKSFLDSMDRVINKVTWKKMLLTGQTFHDHEKERYWLLPPITSMYQPFQFGGQRIMLSASYSRVFKSRKNVFVSGSTSYGFRNDDVNGNISLSRMYNPFNRGFYRVSFARDFQYIYNGDAWINMLKRSNVYLNTGVGIGHGIELLNGLFFYSDIDFSFRKSVSKYGINPRIDSLFPDLLANNVAPSFQPYNAAYGKLRLTYTPKQRYIREPREKIILGSAWPTFYVLWRKGVPKIFDSKVDFDYLEFGAEQEVRLGLVGTSTYSFRTGSFLNRKDLRLVDYKFQRRGDPVLFMNPQEAFQSLDSTFPLFRRFYQAHYLHEFNGALLSKIPLLQKLQLREIAGGGFLLAPERNLRYAEVFTGIERVFKWPFDVNMKFKLGVYAVGSAANNFRNPVQFKIGVTSWDKRSNKWF